MKSNNLFFWFFIIGGFITAGIGVLYFLSGESSRASDGQNYSIFVQIILGIVVTVYGFRKYCEDEAKE
jgi:hypothetical protein